MNRAPVGPVRDTALVASATCCPRCATPMSTYERSGVQIDQCPDCRGMFLDRGELERLVDAESGGWTGPRMRAPEPIPVSRLRAGRGYHSEWSDAPEDER